MGNLTRSCLWWLEFIHSLRNACWNQCQQTPIFGFVCRTKLAASFLTETSMTELETELWNVIEKNAKGNFLGLLKQIADIYDKQGILISVCATRKPEQDSESAQSAQSSQCFLWVTIDLKLMSSSHNLSVQASKGAKTLLTKHFCNTSLAYLLNGKTFQRLRLLRQVYITFFLTCYCLLISSFQVWRTREYLFPFSVNTRKISYRSRENPCFENIVNVP